MSKYRAFDRNRVRLARLALRRMALRVEGNRGGSYDLPEVISRGFPADDTRARRNWAGPQFRTSEVEGNLAGFACFLSGSLQVVNHAQPLLRTSCAQFTRMIFIPRLGNFEQARIVGGLAWHGDHDANIAIGRGFAKRFNVCFSSRAEPESNSAKVSSIERPGHSLPANLYSRSRSASSVAITWDSRRPSELSASRPRSCCNSRMSCRRRLK